MKRVPKSLFTIYLVIMAVVWSIINTLNNPFFNLMALIGILSMIAMFFESTIWSRAVNIVVFVGAGMIVEPVGLILLRALKYGAIPEEDYKYYFVVVICAFIRVSDGTLWEVQTAL